MPQNSSDFVTDLSRQVVLDVAPREMPIFEATSAAYFKNPEKTLKGGHHKEDMLGFGVAETVTMLTPIALKVTTVVVQYVYELSREPIEGLIQDKIEEETPNLLGHLGRIFRKVFGIAEPAKVPALEKPPALTQEQLRQVQELAFEQACQLKLSPDKATLLANSLVGQLAVA